MLRVGIDVGGTNTDAVVLDARAVLAGVKVSTSEDVTSGIIEALEAVIDAAGITREAIGMVMIGTTHFTNAVIERREIEEVAAIRLALPAGAGLPPMIDWPKDIRGVVGNHVYQVKGGYEFDGREISPLDEDALVRIAGDIRAKGLKAAAVTGVFCGINDAMERRAGEVLQAHCPGLSVVLSNDIGQHGLLARESATIMNASLLSLAERTVSAFAGALAGAGITCPFYVTQNDGTLMAADIVREKPVLTFASGPTNSMRGAAFLTGLREAIVVDVGGTTSDIGSLHLGFPRQAATTVDIGGVRTNFRMPDVLSIGLGGGSLVTDDGATIGPRSVGYRVSKEALVFGGKTLTATDIAVARGRTDIGERERVARLDRALVERAGERIAEMIEQCVERARVSADPVPVIAVGGGSVLMPERIGDLKVVRPENFAVANAVGAAIAQISGETDRIFSLVEGRTRESALAQAEDEARGRAIEAGALASTLEVIEREDTPLAYLPGNATRIHVKVVGEMGAIDV
ncbi:hydantoinase/oxoprolinase N-terminal domain-containing protein [Pararhizobium mangrovi]|uniref:Hydantoinase/oxoprolinase family protein n=1 Tax=Pararhizobium mangrovi TaxID=2590452 RepID=A0A506UFT3_9HYPH|nr:hydantoinase/oxoprolinase family protein [Pararhizobium mangrovi]TPW31984.1 hydantoinase/oxoprolinase family protein [Pararhizobium mangrovi]